MVLLGFQRRPSNTVFLYLLRVLRSVAPLVSSQSHISLGDGYSVVNVHVKKSFSAPPSGRYFYVKKHIIKNANIL